MRLQLAVLVHGGHLTPVHKYFSVAELHGSSFLQLSLDTVNGYSAGRCSATVRTTELELFKAIKLHH